MMSDFNSFIAPLAESFIVYRKATGFWNNSYESSLLYFDRYCNESHSTATKLTQEIVDDWCAVRENETNNSCRARIYPIIMFIDYLINRDKTDISRPDIPKYDKRTYIPHAFSQDELHKFFKACDELPNYPNSKVIMLRKLTIPVFFRLLYSSGVRHCEATMLLVENVDLEQGVLNIQHSKGSSQHYVALHHTMFALMKEYNNDVSKICPERKYFFPSSRGNSFRGSSWIQWNFQKLWRKYNNTNATAYDLRHNYAVENINQWTGDSFDFSKLMQLSRSMGHNQIEHTRYYYQLVPALADTIENLTGQSFDEIVPEVYCEKI